MKLPFTTVCSIFILIFYLTILLTVPAKAQDVTSESDFFEDTPLILTASRMSKPLMESPASVSVIDRQMIEAAGIRELADIFRLVPGFIVGNLSGNTPVITYQGLGQDFARQIQVLVDGRSVFIPSFGGVPWANLPLLIEDIERVEVIRGPNSVTYGANAFLATINIITRHAAEDLGVRYSLTASDSTNLRIRDTYIRLGYHLDDLDWRLSVGSLKDEGFQSVFDSRETDKLNFRLDYQADNSRFWTFQSGTSNTISGIGEADNENNRERYADATNSYFNINWEQVRVSGSTNVRLTHTEQKVIDEFDMLPTTSEEPDPFDPPNLMDVTITAFIDFGRISNRTDLEIVHTTEFEDNLRVVYGASLRRDRIKSFFFFYNDEFYNIDTSRLFTSFEWRFAHDWILDVGTTLEDSSITDKEYSPRLSILHSLNDNHMLRLVASWAKRNPILYEHSGLSIFPASVSTTSINPMLGSFDADLKKAEGNPNITPENLVSYEIGLRSQNHDYAISSDVKLFTYKISDHINSTSFEEDQGIFGTTDIDTVENSEDIRVNGLEAALDISPAKGLDIKTGLSFVRVDAAFNDVKISYPETSAFVTALYAWQSKHSLSASYYYTDDMAWFDAKSIPSINKLDLRYAYMFDETSETRIEIVGQNMLGDYIDYIPQNLYERVYFLRLSGSF
ncbi:MAG: TonB-dependent receptor [Gammaproteobacteria bacterium]|nr:TonB-dependent receptor [Gammaproteobacteria bacterium]